MCDGRALHRISAFGNGRQDPTPFRPAHTGPTQTALQAVPHHPATTSLANNHIGASDFTIRNGHPTPRIQDKALTHSIASA